MGSDHVINTIFMTVMIFVFVALGCGMCVYSNNDDEEEGKGKVAFKCMPIIAGGMIMISVICLLISFFHGCDTMFTDDVGPIFSIIFGVIFLTIWCQVFFVVSAEVERKYRLKGQIGSAIEM